MTRFTGKVIAGLIGFLAFGPAGLLFGLVLGHAFDQGSWRGAVFHPVLLLWRGRP